MKRPSARTDRLSIDVLRPEHAEVLFADLRDERIYSYILERPPASVESLRVRYEQLVAGPGPGASEEWLNWVMAERAALRPIGTLQATVQPGDRRALVAYTVFPRYWKLGFATEGLVWLLEHLRAQPGIERAVAEIDSRNEASLALVRRLGFEYIETVPTDEGRDHLFCKQLKASASAGA